MKVPKPALLLSIFLLAILPGCLDLMEEDLSPELEIDIIDHWTNTTAPDEGTAMKDHVWLMVKLNFSNNNEKVDHNIKFNRMFLGASDGNEYWCKGMDPEESGLEHGTSGEFTFLFEIPAGLEPEWIEYQNTMGERFRGHF